MIALNNCVHAICELHGTISIGSSKPGHKCGKVTCSTVQFVCYVVVVIKFSMQKKTRHKNDKKKTMFYLPKIITRIPTTHMFIQFHIIRNKCVCACVSDNNKQTTSTTITIHTERVQQQGVSLLYITSIKTTIKPSM